ncbi:MAG: hypothetical protein IT546_10015 [Caulobacteraceae bacterium]|nr:hypothetical protein [Caulobacteraceae bacterium]
MTGARRIAVVGISGSGKSTYARELARRTGLPLHHMDALFWRGAWEPVPEAEYLAAHERLTAGADWIIEGYVDGAMTSRLRRADQVIHLDYRGPLCAWRVLRRWIAHRRTSRPELPPGARERLSLSFLLLVLRRAERPAIEAALQGVDPAKILRVTSPRQLESIAKLTPRHET